MILKNLTRNFTSIPNELIIDTSISEKAFRLYCYLASKPESWEINNTDIMKNLKIGSNNSLAKYWKELINSGWIEKQKEKDKSGKFTGKTILILHNNRNRKSCENGNLPKSQDNRNRKSCEIAKSAIHNNTDIYSNTEYSSNTENTKKEKINKKEKKFFEDVLVQSLMNDLGVDEEFVRDLIFYRDEIEKPIKTISGLRGLLKEILNASLATKKSAYELAEIMKENEWKTIKASYISQLSNKANPQKNNYTKKDVVSQNMDAVRQAIEMRKRMKGAV